MLYDKKRWEPKVTKPKKPRQTWRTVLLKAAAYMKKHGWTRHRLENDEGVVCMIGAIKSVTKSTMLQDTAINKLENHLYESVSFFNDSTAKNAAEVLGVFRTVAKQGE